MRKLHLLKAIAFWIYWVNCCFLLYSCLYTVLVEDHFKDKALYEMKQCVCCVCFICFDSKLFYVHVKWMKFLCRFVFKLFYVHVKWMKFLRRFDSKLFYIHVKWMKFNCRFVFKFLHTHILLVYGFLSIH